MDDSVKRIVDVQQLLLNNLSKVSVAPKPINTENNVFVEISKYKDNPALVKNALGEVGVKLLSIVSKIDITHPLVSDISGGELVNDSKLYQIVKEIFEIVNTTESKNWGSALEIIRATLNKDFKAILSKLPIRVPPRLILDKKIRLDERKNKLAKPIQIAFSKEVQSNVEDAFFEYPDTFKRYVRSSEAYKEELFRNQKIIKNLQRVCLEHQIEAVQQQGKLIKESISDTYHDFIRLKMKDAAMILARSLSFKFENGANRILVPKKIFGGNDFWNVEKDVDFNNPWSKQPSGDFPYLTYAPRAYPLPKFKATMPPNVERIIGELEAHPAANEKPLFDYYWIIVPSVQVQGNSVKLNGEIKQYAGEWELYSELDSYLVNNDLLCPIILGENTIEKKCYFISYWI